MTTVVTLPKEFLKLQKEKTTIRRTIKDIETQISNLEKELKKIKTDEKHINKKIFKICNHKWVRNWHASHDDLCKHYCGICGLTSYDR